MTGARIEVNGPTDQGEKQILRGKRPRYELSTDRERTSSGLSNKSGRRGSLPASTVDIREERKRNRLHNDKLNLCAASRT